MSQNKNKGIGNFFRALLQQFSAYKKPAPLPSDIPAPTVTAEKEIPHKILSEEIKQPPITPELSAAQYYQLGLNIFQSEIDNDNDIQAFRYFQKAAEQEHAQAQGHLSYMYQMGYGVPKDLQKSFHWSLKASQQNIADAQLNAGLCYLHGWGTSSDLPQAIHWLEAAAKENIADAHRHLGDIYSGYINTPSTQASFNIDTAEQWYLKAAKAGDLHSQLQLAKIYLSEQHSKKNPTLAKQYLEQPAQSNMEEAQYLLGMQYLSPETNRPDYQQASTLLYQAAQSGYPDAIYQLGDLYAHGKGVEKNQNLSVRYFQLAAKAGHRKAKQRLFDDFDLFADELPKKPHERTSITIKLI
ncbi:MAG: tetratricopeptide repeat protein [Saezia sp.]